MDDGRNRAEMGSAAPASGEAAAVGCLRVLVVDDNQDNAIVTAALIRLWGYAAMPCFDGHEAMRVAPEFLPDVVLLDLGMPIVTGYDVLRFIRLQPALSGACVVAMTGYGMEADRKATSEAGFDLHLLKPVPADQLKATLQSIRPVR